MERFLRQALDDLRFSLRLLRKQPGFALLATTCLAIGIGANTSIFSLLNALLLRSLPFQGSDRLVVLHRGKHFRFSLPDYKDLAFRFQASGSMLATLATESSLDRIGSQGQLVNAEAVTGNYARVLHAGTALGNWFVNEDSPVAVISYRVWQEMFHSDPKALGQQVRSETQWYTVIGVASEDFAGLALPRTTSIWVPLRVWTRQHPTMQIRSEDRDSPLVTVFARLSPTVTNWQATAHLRVIENQLNRETVRRRIFQDPIGTDTVRGVTESGDRATVQRVIDLLFGVVGVLLLICCVNVGNLLLVRGASRQSEVAIRYSLGATRSRILWQLLMDSVLLAALGGIGGLVIDLLLVRLILHLLPALPLGETISPSVPLDWRVIAFVVTSAVTTVFIFGLLPAWKTSATDLSNKIRSSLSTVDGVRLRKSAAILQVALSFLLLVIAALFLITCWRLEYVHPGFEVRSRLYATTYISKPEFKPEQFPDFYRQVLNDLRSTPNIRSAALTYLLPLNPPDTECIKNSAFDEIRATTSTISPGFLHTLAIPLLQGRDFDSSDRAKTQSVILINQVLAHRLWPNTTAVGRQVELGCSERLPAKVVGVVANSRTVSLTRPIGAHFYRAFAQNATGLANIVVELSGAPAAASEKLRRALLNEGHGLRVYAVNTLSFHLDESFWQLQWEAWLLGAFGAAALLLAALGLYGVVSYSTTLRTKEFGLRIAIGAQTSDILQLVVKEGLVIGAFGACLGSLATFALTGFLRNYLVVPGISVGFTCVGVGILWLIIVTGACYAPARRSSRVEPSTTLRNE